MYLHVAVRSLGVCQDRDEHRIGQKYQRQEVRSWLLTACAAAACFSGGGTSRGSAIGARLTRAVTVLSLTCYAALTVVEPRPIQGFSKPLQVILNVR